MLAFITGLVWKVSKLLLAPRLPLNQGVGLFRLKLMLAKATAKSGLWMLAGTALLILGCSKEPSSSPTPANGVQSEMAFRFAEREITNATSTLGGRRAAADRLVGTAEGAHQLLEWASNDELPVEFRPYLTMLLAHVPYEGIRNRAAEVLPPYMDRNQRLLPPLSDFFKLKGNPARGPELFRHPDLNCIGCHRLNGEGVALGSDLSDVGLRLDALTLLESLLDPSAIITPGYETWLVVDQEENEHVGVLSRETPEAVVLRDAKNNEIVVPKNRIKQKQQVPVSLMPAGLQQSMTLQDLVDLWLFLRGCKQPPVSQGQPPAGPGAKAPK